MHDITKLKHPSMMRIKMSMWDMWVCWESKSLACSWTTCCAALMGVSVLSQNCLTILLRRSVATRVEEWQGIITNSRVVHTSILSIYSGFCLSLLVLVVYVLAVQITPSTSSKFIIWLPSPQLAQGAWMNVST
jgi:hypothetical protein